MHSLFFRMLLRGSNEICFFVGEQCEELLRGARAERGRADRQGTEPHRLQGIIREPVSHGKYQTIQLLID